MAFACIQCVEHYIRRCLSVLQLLLCFAYEVVNVIWIETTLEQKRSGRIEKLLSKAER